MDLRLPSRSCHTIFTSVQYTLSAFIIDFPLDPSRSHGKPIDGPIIVEFIAPSLKDICGMPLPLAHGTCLLVSSSTLRKFLTAKPGRHNAEVILLPRFDPSLLRINPFSRVRCWILCFLPWSRLFYASGSDHQDILNALGENREEELQLCAFPSSSARTVFSMIQAVKIQHVKIQFFANRNSETRHVMDWRLSESSTADHGLSWSTSTCHLPSWCRRKQTLFHMLKARDLHAIFIIGSEKQLRNQSVWYCNTVCLNNPAIGFSSNSIAVRLKNPGCRSCRLKLLYQNRSTMWHTKICWIIRPFIPLQTYKDRFQPDKPIP